VLRLQRLQRLAHQPPSAMLLVCVCVCVMWWWYFRALPTPRSQPPTAQTVARGLGAKAGFHPAPLTRIQQCLVLLLGTAIGCTAFFHTFSRCR
jgi:hypothetical protein